MSSRIYYTCEYESTLEMTHTYETGISYRKKKIIEETESAIVDGQHMLGHNVTNVVRLHVERRD